MVVLTHPNVSVAEIRATIENPGGDSYGNPFWPQVVVHDGEAYRVTGSSKYGDRVYEYAFSCLDTVVSDEERGKPQ